MVCVACCAVCVAYCTVCGARCASYFDGTRQIGKSFRNEITPGNFIFRTREFEQMELEYLCHPRDAAAWYALPCLPSHPPAVRARAYRSRWLHARPAAQPTTHPRSLSAFPHRTNPEQHARRGDACMHACRRRRRRDGGSQVTVGGSVATAAIVHGALLRSERRGCRFEHWVSECHAWLLKYGLREENVRRVRFPPALMRPCSPTRP
jgi:hypothetical protein